VAVRRDSGEPQPDEGTIARMAEAAYAAHPEAIPYESSRYRASADLNGDGYVADRTELFPMYEAQRGTTVSRCSSPRLVRLGLEVLF